MKHCLLLAFFLHVVKTLGINPQNEPSTPLPPQGTMGSTNIETPALLTESTGIPVGDIENILTVGRYGNMLFQDVVFFDQITHFTRERIPERVVHAKGAGAFGYFQVTHDITKYTKAVVFSQIGKVTDIAVRFSTVAGGVGSAETVRDVFGFAIKFYTEQGNWDLLGLNSPIFVIRDALLFPQFIHSQKKNPSSNLKDFNSTWDFFTLEQESTHHLMHLYSDTGIPNGFRHMDGHAINTFKMVNANGNAVYCKFHFTTDQGVEGLDPAVAQILAGSSPDYDTQDLYEAIANRNYPSWSFSIQVMTFEEAEKFRWNPFDATKLWPEKDFPLMPVGKLVLNRNPANYFAEIEQLSFQAANMIPGIEPSPDKVLQGRLFVYGDTQRYRLGTNFMQIPVNCPFRTKVRNYQRDGMMTVTDNQGGSPNYYPNSYGGPQSNVKYLQSSFNLSGDVTRYNSTDEDNFSQPTILWTQGLNATQKQSLVSNLAANLVNVAPFIRQRAITMFTNVHKDFGQALTVAIKKLE